MISKSYNILASSGGHQSKLTILHRNRASKSSADQSLKQRRTTTRTICGFRTTKKALMRPKTIFNLLPSKRSATLQQFSNWKSPGSTTIDNIQFYNAPQTVEIYNKITQHPEISCAIKLSFYNLPILSSIITSRMQNHLNVYGIIPEEQKGCVPGKQGTIDQLMIDKMILNNAKSSKRNLWTAWIDYKKAFDSIPHEWLIKRLEIHKFSDVIVNFFKTLMKTWQTRLTLSTDNNIVTTDDITIKTGIFQGDCPSGFHYTNTLEWFRTTPSKQERWDDRIRTSTSHGWRRS